MVVLTRRVRDLRDDQVLYLINYDNIYHLKYKMQTRGDIANDVMTEHYGFLRGQTETV